MSDALIENLEAKKIAIGQSAGLRSDSFRQGWNDAIDEAIAIIRQHTAAALDSRDINAPENESSIGYAESGRTAAPEVVEALKHTYVYKLRCEYSDAVK